VNLSLKDSYQGLIVLVFQKIQVKLKNHLKSKLEYLKTFFYKSLRRSTQVLNDILYQHTENLKKTPQKFTDFCRFIKEKDSAKLETPKNQHRYH